MSTLMTLARVYEKYNILDVGCGPGYATRLLTTDVSNLGSTIYALDFSPEMIKLAQKVFSEYDDFNCNQKNYWDCREQPILDQINIEKDTKEIRKEKNGKVVRFLQGIAESLPFEDSQFDVYISNFCLMLCLDADQAIKESYRVLKENGVAALTIWGKLEQTKIIWTIFADVFQKYGIDANNQKNSFWLAKDPAELKNKFLQAGYKQVRIEYTSEIYDCFDETEFLQQFQTPNINSILESIQEDQKVKEILELAKVEARKQIVDNLQLPILNVMTIVAFK